MKPFNFTQQFLVFVVTIATIAVSCNVNIKEIEDHKKDLYFLTGSYSESSADGVKLFKVDADSCLISGVAGVGAGTNPSFIMLSPRRDLVYVVNEITPGLTGPRAGVTTLKFDRQAIKLENAGYTEISGAGPCHVSCDSTGDYLFLSNYGDGSLSVLGVDTSGLPDIETIYLKYSDDTSEVSHVHMALQIPGNKSLLISDLGLNRLIEYRIGYSKNNLNLIEERTVNLRDGSGPRHFAPWENGKYIYVVSEISSELVVLKRTITGDFITIQTIKTIPLDYDGVNYCADIKISHCGRYLYVTNRGHNTIATFVIQDTGKVELREIVSCEGDWPRNVAIDNDDRILLVANQRSDNIALFHIDKESGIPVYSDISINITSPSCVIFIPEK